MRSDLLRHTKHHQLYSFSSHTEKYGRHARRLGCDAQQNNIVPLGLLHSALLISIQLNASPSSSFEALMSPVILTTKKSVVLRCD